MVKRKKAKKNGLKNIKGSDKKTDTNPTESLKDNSESIPIDDSYFEIQSSLDKNIGINFMNIETIFDDIHSKMNTELCIPWSKWITN